MFDPRQYTVGAARGRQFHRVEPVGTRPVRQPSGGRASAGRIGHRDLGTACQDHLGAPPAHPFGGGGQSPVGVRHGTALDDHHIRHPRGGVPAEHIGAHRGDDGPALHRGRSVQGARDPIGVAVVVDRREQRGIDDPGAFLISDERRARERFPQSHQDFRVFCPAGRRCRSGGSRRHRVAHLITRARVQHHSGPATTGPVHGQDAARGVVGRVVGGRDIEQVADSTGALGEVAGGNTRIECAAVAGGVEDAQRRNTGLLCGNSDPYRIGHRKQFGYSSFGRGGTHGQVEKYRDGHRGVLRSCRCRRAVRAVIARPAALRGVRLPRGSRAGPGPGDRAASSRRIRCGTTRAGIVRGSDGRRNRRSRRAIRRASH